MPIGEAVIIALTIIFFVFVVLTALYFIVKLFSVIAIKITEKTKNNSKNV